MVEDKSKTNVGVRCSRTRGCIKLQISLTKYWIVCETDVSELEQDDFSELESRAEDSVSRSEGERDTVVSRLLVLGNCTLASSGNPSRKRHIPSS
jgi:hypothetical protein